MHDMPMPRAGARDLRRVAATWLSAPGAVVEVPDAVAALRRAIDRCLRLQAEWLESEARLVDALETRIGRHRAIVERAERVLDDTAGRLLEVARFLDPLKHPRWPAGDPQSRGGRFRLREGGDGLFVPAQGNNRDQRYPPRWPPRKRPDDPHPHYEPPLERPERGDLPYEPDLNDPFFLRREEGGRLGGHA